MVAGGFFSRRSSDNPWFRPDANETRPVFTCPMTNLA